MKILKVCGRAPDLGRPSRAELTLTFLHQVHDALVLDPREVDAEPLGEQPVGLLIDLHQGHLGTTEEQILVVRWHIHHRDLGGRARHQRRQVMRLEHLVEHERDACGREHLPRPGTGRSC